MTRDDGALLERASELAEIDVCLAAARHRGTRRPSGGAEEVAQ